MSQVDVLKQPDKLPEQFVSWLRRFISDNTLISAKGVGAAASTAQAIQLYPDTPDASGNATPGITGGFSNVRRLLPYLAHAGDGYWMAFVRIPDNYKSGGVIKLTGVANATTGVVRLVVGTAVVANGVSEDPSPADETAQNVTVPGTALKRFDTSFTISGSTPAAGSDLIVRIKRNAANAADTCTASYGIWGVVFSYSS